MKTLKILLAFAVLSTVLYSCKKSTTPGSSTMQVKMTDGPGNYDAVNIDLQSVVVTGNTGGDVTLNTHAGIYNLLNFSNGIDTLIATGNLNVASVEQIRLVLGPNNSVVVGGVSYPLSTPSAQQSGLKLQVHQSLQAGVSYSVLLDFDANQSIVVQGNGSYSLKPVIRTVETAISGSIKGSITPVSAGVMVTATLNGTSYSTVTQMNGEFLLQGIPPGSYSVTLTPALPLSPITINNVSVSTGATTDIGMVNL